MVLASLEYHVAKAYLFIGYVAGNEALYTSLPQAGYVVIFKPTIPGKDMDSPFLTTLKNLS